MQLYRTAALFGLVVLVCAQDSEDGEEGEGKSKRDIVGQYAYCMEDNCYELLGVKKDAGGIAIKRSYRKLATEWHPDKNPNPEAKSIFQKYANAYEVLSSPEMRDNYDYLLDHPYEFPMHFMRFSRAKFAPKTDLRAVLIFTVLIISVCQFYFRKQHYELSLKEIKNHPRYQERLKQLMADEYKVGLMKKGGSAKSKSAKGDKVDEARKAAEAQLEEEVISQLHQPARYEDTLVFTLFVAPLTCYYSSQANFTWFMRFKVRGEEYGTVEKAYLTQKALGLTSADWAEYAEEEQTELQELELWVKANKAEYDEEEADLARAGKTKNAKQKREKRESKKRTGKFVMDD